MKLSEKLLMVANWLEDSENDLIINAENDEKSLTVVANALVKAAVILKNAAAEVSETEPVGLTPDKMDGIAALAQVCDDSGDEFLKKQASVLDEILLTIAAPRNSAIQFRDTVDDRIEELKKKYKDTKSQQDEMNKVSDSIKNIEKSPMYKQRRPLEAPLSMRYCPDHGSGVMVVRVGEHTVQCTLDKKIYNYETGYTTLNGDKVPGGDVSLQTPIHTQEGHLSFDTRNGRLGQQDK